MPLIRHTVHNKMSSCRPSGLILHLDLDAVRDQPLHVARQHPNAAGGEVDSLPASQHYFSMVFEDSNLDHQIGRWLGIGSEVKNTNLFHISFHSFTILGVKIFLLNAHVAFEILWEGALLPPHSFESFDSLIAVGGGGGTAHVGVRVGGGVNMRSVAQ